VTAEATPAPAAAAEAPIPEVTGKTIVDAREMLRRAGLRFTVHLIDERSKPPGIVQTQALADTAANQPRRVILTATPVATVLVHYAQQGDEQVAEDLVKYLKDQPSTIGTIVRSVKAAARTELAGHVGYSEDRLAGQADAIARDASEFLTRTKRPPLRVAVRPRVARSVMILALY